MFLYYFYIWDYSIIVLLHHPFPTFKSSHVLLFTHCQIHGLHARCLHFISELITLPSMRCPWLWSHSFPVFLQHHMNNCVICKQDYVILHYKFCSHPLLLTKWSSVSTKGHSLLLPPLCLTLSHAVHSPNSLYLLSSFPLSSLFR